MKYLFLIISVILIISGIGIYASFPDLRSDVPVIYWVTDPNPARQEQVALFHEWQIDQQVGQVHELATPADARALHQLELGDGLLRAMRQMHDAGPLLWDEQLNPLMPEASTLPLTVVVPRMELRLDSANRNLSKQIIQSVSGVAGDVMDLMGYRVPFFVDMGVLADMTEAGRRLGFAPSHTWAAIEPEITQNGRQYAFPCNVYVMMHWANVETFARYDMPPPPRRWTFEEFEAYGKQFVERANAGLERRTFFLTNEVGLTTMHRSLGLSRFNETMTRCTLDDPRFAQVLALKKKWTDEDHILPSAADEQSFDTQAGYGGAMLQLFNRGNYGMFRRGRYALIKLRQFNAERAKQGLGPFQYAICEPPHGGYPNAITGTRSAGVYIDGKPDQAKYFLAYLASEKYNMQIVRDADALPPDPAYTNSELFRRPPDHPEEWGIHEVFAEAAQQIAIVNVHSPFVTASEVVRHMDNADQATLAETLSPEAAALETTKRINRSIEHTIKEDADLAAEYERRLVIQAKIDQRRAAGQPVPIEWINNVFYRRYYREQGWLE